MNTLPPGFELESPALPAGFEFENVPQPPEGFQLEGVLVNDRPRLDEAGFQGNEQPNARAIGPFSWPLEVIEQGATKLGNFVLDPRYGILNKVLQGLGRTGFATEQMEFGSPEYAQGQPTPIKPLFGAGQPIVTGQFANEDVDPVNRMTGNLLRGFTTPGSALTLGAGTALKIPKVMAIVFGGPMLEQAPETTAQMGAKVGEYVGTPPEQRTEQQKQETADAVLNEAVNKLMLGGIAQGAKFSWDNRPLTPEVLPPLKDAPPFQPLERRLGNETYIDADVTGQKLLSEGQKQIGFPSMAEALAKVAESLPKQEAGDAASLGAGAKMMPGEGQSSAPESKAPISEDGNVHGGAQANLPPEQRAISEKNNSPDAWAEFRRQMEEQKKQSGSTKEQDNSIPIEDRGSAGGNLSSFGFLDPAFWKQQLGIAHETKTDAVQLYNRVRNKLGERSASWEMLNTPEFKAYMTGVKSPSEVEKWVEGNGPKVEVRKFGEGSLSEARKEYNRMTHEWFDMLGALKPNIESALRWDAGDEPVKENLIKHYGWTKENAQKAERFIELRKLTSKEPKEASANWSSIAPKPESSMPGYVEIAVVKPYRRNPTPEEYDNMEGDSVSGFVNPAPRETGIQFPTSHSFPPNTLGFVRGYMEGDTFHVVEVQSDWAQQQRESKEIAKRYTPEDYRNKEIAAKDDPLLSHYERLALKAAVEHARSVGAKKIAIQDAESAMMMEGHDRLVSMIEPIKTEDMLDRATEQDLIRRYGLDWKQGEYARFNDGLYRTDKPEVNQGFTAGPGGGSVKRADVAKELAPYLAGKGTTGFIPQDKGMRLHYDQTLPRILSELTGSKGEKMSFGEHKMAMRDITGAYDELQRQIKEPRKDLIFRNPDGTPKTDVSALSFPLAPVKEHLTYTGKDAPPKVEAQTPMVHAGQAVKPGMVTGKVPEKMSQLMREYGLPENASHAEVVKAHRERAKTLHPDKGGSADAMAHENAMFDAIEDKMIKQVVRGQREMTESLVPAAEGAISDLKDAIDAKRAGRVSEKYGPADAHTLERWQLALQKAVQPFKAKGITIRPGSGETGALNLSTIKDMVKLAGAPVKSAGQAVRWYSEPLVERLGRMGGPVSKMVSEAGGQIISRQKMYYGRITPLIDPAKKAMGRPNAANMWMRKLHRYNERAAVNNMFAQNEGTVPVNPAASRETALLDRANLAVGHLATLANPGFVPSNKLQRMLTSYGVDVVRRGAGPAWEAWTKGVADANGVTLASVQGFFRRWKAEMDEPTSDVAALNSINQDFTRFYPKSVTHIKPGVAWHEVIVADPFAYLEGAAQRTATAVAFREVFPAGSRMLQNTRKLVQAELRTDTQGTEFDNLIRALQGHPTDTFVSTLTAPDSWSGGGMRMLSQVVGTPLKSLMLTGNAATNIGEVVVGGPSIFFGYRNVLPAMLKLPWGWNQIYLNGQGNRALQNWAYDPSSPVRSLARAASSTVRLVSMQQNLNELQEAQAAISARQVTDQIRNGTLPPSQNENIVAVARFMSMTEAQARRMLAGDRALLDQFDRAAASMLTGGHVSMAERSRAGTSRAFNELFWFHSYPQMTLNQVRRVMENLSDDVTKGNIPQAKANAKLLGRLIAGRTMQGAITAGIYALVFGGLFGLAVKKKEAKDNLDKFLLDSFLGGLGGPAAIGKRLLEQGGDSKTLAANVAAISTPVSAASDIYDMSMGNGKYEGRGSFERIGMFLESKTPAAKMFETGMALYGLSEGNPKLDVAKKAFYRWKRDVKGWKSTSESADSEESQQFTAQMRRTLSALQNGGDWRTELGKVKGKNENSASKSMFSQTILKDKDSKGLSEEDLGLLRKRIGDEAVNLLQAHDAMVRQIARELGENEGDVSKLSTKPLGLAVDAMSQGKRVERLQDQLAVDVSEWLTKNKLHLNDVTPERKLAGRQEKLDVPQYQRLEAAAVQEYEAAIRRLMLNPSFQSRPHKEQQERLNTVLDLAEKRAKRLSR